MINVSYNAKVPHPIHGHGGNSLRNLVSIFACACIRLVGAYNSPDVRYSAYEGTSHAVLNAD